LGLLRKNFKSELALASEAFIQKGKKSVIANFEANELSQTRQFILDQNEETRKLMKESNDHAMDHIDHTMDHINQQLKEMEERWGKVFKIVYRINWRTGLPIDSFVNNMEIKYEGIRLNNKTARKGFFYHRHRRSLRSIWMCRRCLSGEEQLNSTERNRPRVEEGFGLSKKRGR